MSLKILEQLVVNWQKTLLENKAALEHLKRYRGIERIKDLELGLVEVPKAEELPEAQAKALKSFGILNPDLDSMISIPLRAKDGRISNFLMLSLNGTGDRILRKGGLLNAKAFKAFKQIIAVDNLDDFITYFHRVKENVVPVIQTGEMMTDFAEALKDSKAEEVILLKKSPYWEYVKAKVYDSGADVKIYETIFPGNMSIREFLRGSSGNKFRAMIEAEKAKIIKRDTARQKERELERIKEKEGNKIAEDPRRGGLPPAHEMVKERLRNGFETEGITGKDDEPPEEAPRLELKEEPGEIRFSAEDRHYRVRGFAKDGFEKIVQLSLDIDGDSFPDKIDLSRSQARARFANISGTEFEVSPEVIREDLSFIYQALDNIQTERYNRKLGIDKKEVHIITPQEESKAIDILTKRDLLSEILPKDTEKLGYVEDEINKKIYYISGISRLTEEPVSVLNISPPGTGKSFGISTIMELMPPEELLKYSRLTPTALYYKEESELKGRALYIEEIVGMEESLEALRMLISSGEISTASTQKDPRTGTLKTMNIRSKVNMPVLSSGVKDIFDEETMSRFILTYNDSKEGHIKRIMKAQSYKYSLEGEKNELARSRILKKHRDIQKVLDRTVKVVIPFAEKIQLNPGLHIVTRKQEQYLRFIYNIAFLRQHSRERHKDTDRYGNELTYIKAGMEDAETANEIIKYAFNYLKEDLTKRQYDAYTAIVEYCKEGVKEKRISLYEYRFSRRDIRERTGWEAATTKRIFDELESLEYIRKVGGRSQGTRYLYTLVPHEGKLRVKDLKLLDPEEV